MAVSSPPRPLRPSDPVERDELDALVQALIEEARRRARRRRRIYAGFGILAAFAGAAVFTILGRSAHSQTASPALSPRFGSSLASTKPRLAFVSSAARGWRHAWIFVMNADGSGRRRVTAYTGFGADLVWSPDGNQLAFTRGYPWTAHIYVVRTDGSGERRLTRDPANESPKAWSPDGRKIAFIRWHGPNSWGNDLYVMNADGSSVHRLSPTFSGVGSLAWSPEGRKIAFVGWLGSPAAMAVYVMKADGSDPRKLTDTAPDLGSLAWSPDGREIAFVKRATCSPWPRCGHAEVWVTNTDGSGRRRVAVAGQIDSELSWSPDGRSLVYASHYRPHPNQPGVRYLKVWNVFRVNADGSGKRRLTDGGQPLWSPDGKQIAFIRWPGGRGELYLMNPDGSGQRRITHTGYGEGTFAWAPGRQAGP